MTMDQEGPPSRCPEEWATLSPSSLRQQRFSGTMAPMRASPVPSLPLPISSAAVSPEVTPTLQTQAPPPGAPVSVALHGFPLLPLIALRLVCLPGAEIRLWFWALLSPPPPLSLVTSLCPRRPFDVGGTLLPSPGAHSRWPLHLAVVACLGEP